MMIKHAFSDHRSVFSLCSFSFSSWNLEVFHIAYKKLMCLLDVTSSRDDMSINVQVKKTKTMRISRRGGEKLHVKIYGKPV